MPYISPIARFWIGVIVTIAIGVSSGTVVLTNAVPEAWIKPAVAWCGIIAFGGSAVLTALNALASTMGSKVQSAANIPEVQKIITTSEVANSSQFATNDKVVAK